MKDILLVCMPFGNAYAPALGISLLRDSVRQHGYNCEIRYLQMRFARQIGIELYNQIIDSFPSLMLGEWLFAHHLYQDSGGLRLPSEQEYLDKILRDYTMAHGRSIPEEFIARMPEVRAMTGVYLDDCMRAIPWEKYDVVGFTSTFAQHLASLAMAKRIKQEYPDMYIVFGGANCEDEMGLETHRQYPFVDFVCSGEGDVLFPTLIQRLNTGGRLDDIQGLVYRQAGESVANGSSAAPIFEMDSLPFANFDDYFAQLEENELWLEPASIHLMMESSRGCWWGAKSHCTFCGLNGNTMTYRSKSPGRVLDEFTYLAQRYPHIKSFTLVDNILDVRYFRDVIPGLIEKNLGIFIWYEVKANLRKEQLQMLKLAGVDAIQPGIESLDSEILRLMRKGCTTTQNVQTLKWARQYGLYVDWNLITGFPGEDQDAYRQMAEMLPALAHLQPPTSRGVSRLRLDRFSPYFHDPQSYGIINVIPVEAYHYIYPFAQDVVARLAYYFDFDYDDGRIPESYTGMLNQAIEKWHDHENDGSLQYMRSNGRITLYDTRASARKMEIVLEGLTRAIYEFCDEGQTFPTILRFAAQAAESGDSFGTGSINQEQIQAILDELVEARVMLHADDRYLSLAIPLDENADRFIDNFVNVLLASQPEAMGQSTIQVPIDDVLVSRGGEEIR
jgi:ribosomal peptide maturation radical SAM protein 1